jgi:hypothetical protein
MNKQPSLPGTSRYKPRQSKQRGYKRQTPEFAMQCRLFAFLRDNAKREPRFGFVFAIPNGLHLSPKTAADAVAQGVLAGVWDVFLPYQGEGACSQYYGLFVEMKHGTNNLTESQKRFRDGIGAVYGCVVCRSWQQAATEICTYLGVTDPAILDAIR